MANPRQRRKSRSGGKIKTSKQSLKNKHKVVVKGPEVLAKNWDKTKTVRQNYQTLGLLGTLDPRQAGGLEPLQSHVPYAVRSATEPMSVEEIDRTIEEQVNVESDAEEEEGEGEGEKKQKDKKGKGKGKEEQKLEPGMARIIRDDSGNIVKIVVVGEEGGEEREEEIREPNRGTEDSEDDEDEEGDSDSDEEMEEDSTTRTTTTGRGKKGKKNTMTPWGKPMKDWDVTEDQFQDEEKPFEGIDLDPREIKQGIPIEGAMRRVEAKTDVVRQLEQRASQKTKVVRHTSEFEHDWLVALVGKYGDDLDKMARDRKANVWQKTTGELKRMINKAGGVEKLKAAATATA